MSQRVWLGIGGNMGDRLGHLNQAVAFILKHPQLELQKCSRVYETEYVGSGTQMDYLNACLEICSDLAPEDLMKEFQELERSLGRQEDGHLKPRPLDVDILLVDNLIVSCQHLEIPHPRLVERLFVLAPLAEIARSKIIPNSGETVGNLCAKIRRKSGPAVELCQEYILQSGLPDRSLED